MKRLLLPLLAAAVLLGGCGVSPAIQLGQAAHITVYLPSELPQDMRYSGGKSLGKRMLYLHYSAPSQTLVLFESPDPIAPPPGATQSGKETWEAVSVVHGETVRSLLVHRPSTYVEAVATGVSAADFRKVKDSLRAYAP